MVDMNVRNDDSVLLKCRIAALKDVMEVLMDEAKNILSSTYDDMDITITITLPSGANTNKIEISRNFTREDGVEEVYERINPHLRDDV